MDLLAQKRSAIIGAWLARVIQGYSENTAGFLLREKDPFRNPVGDAFRRGLPVLFDQVIGNMDRTELTPALDDIVRIRAVQDFNAGQAIAFVFQLKRTIREVLRDGPPPALENVRLDSVEDRIDELALLAFDLFLKCREKIFETKVNEMKRRTFLLERMHPAFAESAEGEGTQEEPQREKRGGRR
jgi:hypothetical protein